MDLIFLLLPGLCVSAVIGYFIGNIRGDGAAGAIWGLLLGPVGWVLALCLKDARPKCPLCQGVLPSVKVARCKHCGGELRPSQAARAALDPVAEWEKQQALKPGNLKPLTRREGALRPPPPRERRK